MRGISWEAAGSCSKVPCAVPPWPSRGVAARRPHGSVLNPRSGQFPGCDHLLDLVSRLWLRFLHTLCPPAARQPLSEDRVPALHGASTFLVSSVFNWRAVPRLTLLSVARFIASPQRSLISLGLNSLISNFH